MQSGHGATEVAVFGVVLVFDDPRVCGGRPAKEFHAAVGGHDDSHRKLIGRRDVGELRFGRKLATSLHDEAIFVDGHRNNARTCRAECLKRTRVTGIFHPDLVAGREKEATDEIKGMLRTRGDDDLFGRATHPA